MNTDHEFHTLGLTKPQMSSAWEARAKIIWGDKADDVHAWLVESGVAPFTADRIVAVATAERAGTMRKNGTRDLLLGIPIGLAGAAVGFAAVTLVKDEHVNISGRALGVVAAFACLAFLYGTHLTWRGLVRIVGGSRVDGAASDVDD